eukprot:NODE_1849_length_827_cov_117.444730_g1458_i0.p1 GENE.NODE_1849_length_827_cov_117.444730_g1458_i0~~NODE_1849_length_827_cov_117.444730_g1458_i0.p1  ORF type:complete len:196 (+),score=40.62 NODE_1849_length_827_cov_117.444730_g1458_i0:60-590(+)
MADYGNMDHHHEGDRVQLSKKVRHADPNCIRVRHHTTLSDKYWKQLCCQTLPLLGCTAATTALERSYIEVHENRLEYNYPIAACCHVHDSVGVIFFDQSHVSGTGAAGMCTPVCTHMSFFPTCCDLCGEGLVVYNAKRCCWHPFVMLPGLPEHEAETLSKHINDAREEYLHGMEMK